MDIQLLGTKMAAYSTLHQDSYYGMKIFEFVDQVFKLKLCFHFNKCLNQNFEVSRMYFLRNVTSSQNCVPVHKD